MQSKRTSQRRWLQNPEGGKTYHSDKAGVHRVRDWRASNPGYWRRALCAAAQKHDAALDLREVLESFFGRDSCDALQDSWPPQVIALVGLIALLGGHAPGPALQDPIARDLREIMFEGNAILAALAKPAPNKDPSRPRTSG